MSIITYSQDQGGPGLDTYSANGVPLNIITVQVSQQRSLLSILDAVVENSGVYECSGLSQGFMFSDSVTISVESG